MKRRLSRRGAETQREEGGGHEEHEKTQKGQKNGSTPGNRERRWGGESKGCSRMNLTGERRRSRSAARTPPSPAGTHRRRTVLVVERNGPDSEGKGGVPLRRFIVSVLPESGLTLAPLAAELDRLESK